MVGVLRPTIGKPGITIPGNANELGVSIPRMQMVGVLRPTIGKPGVTIPGNKK